MNKRNILSRWKGNMKTQIGKDVEATIRLLRFMTYHQGTAYLSVFDGDGFEEWTLTVYLERDGLTLKNQSAYTSENFKKLIMKASNPFNLKEEEFNEAYKKKKWNDE